jgi:hypothetical protein
MLSIYPSLVFRERRVVSVQPPDHRPLLFISYRHVDSDYSTAIRTQLARFFSLSVVYQDVGRLSGGESLRSLLTQASRARVLVLLLGPEWPRHFKDRKGGQDWVLEEVAAAISSGGHIIPMLLGDAPDFRQARLPRRLDILKDRKLIRAAPPGLGHGDSGSD